jgi:PAS domain S-box-containing protein
LLSLAFLKDTTTDYLKSGTAETLFLMLTQMQFILLTYALVLMVNKRLILAIQLQEEKYSKAFHSSPYGLLLTRLSDGKIVEFNEGVQRSMGFSPHELEGKTTAELNLWANVSDRTAIVDSILAHGRVADREVVFLKKTGERVVGLFSSELIVVNGERHMLSTIQDITGRKRAAEERERLISEREKALSEIKVLSGLLPTCAACKKIRDGEGLWHPMESYVRSHSQADFSHGLCPDCERTLYPESG